MALEPTRDRGDALADVIDAVLDKGLVINADIMVSLAGVGAPRHQGARGARLVRDCRQVRPGVPVRHESPDRRVARRRAGTGALPGLWREVHRAG